MNEKRPIAIEVVITCGQCGREHRNARWLMDSIQEVRDKAWSVSVDEAGRYVVRCNKCEMVEPAKRYAYSTDQENYQGNYASELEAAGECFAAFEDYTRCLVGELVVPKFERLFDAHAVIDEVINAEELSMPAFDDWPLATKEQLDELTADLRKVFSDWLDRHNLRDGFFLVENVSKWRLIDGKAVMEGGE